LGRLHSAVLLGLVPVYGALLMGERDPFHLTILFIIGLLSHTFGFALNEVADLKVDRASSDLKGKPLVKGAISYRAALAFVMGSLALCFILPILVYPDRVYYLIPILIPTVLIGIIYDLRGKRWPGSDFILSFYVLLYCLFGAATVSTAFSEMVWIVAILAYLQTLFQNVVAGLKDADHDHLAGGLTTPLRMGVRVTKGRMVQPRAFCGLLAAVKGVHIGVLFYPIFFGIIEPSPLQLLLLAALSFAMLTSASAISKISSFDRNGIKRMIGVHEIFTYLLFPVLIMGVVGWQIALFLAVFPIIWLAVTLMLLYGKLMPDI